MVSGYVLSNCLIVAKSVADWFKEAALALLSWSFESFGSGVDDAIDILQGNNLGIDVMGVADTLSKKFAPVCSTIIVICAMMELAIYASHVDNLRWEHGIKIGAKLSMAKAFSDQAPALVTAIYNQANSWIGSMSYTSIQSATTANVSDTIVRNIETLSKNMDGLGAWVFMMLTSLVVALAIAACGLLIKVMAYGRIFEVLAYATISPIPCAFLPLTGTTEFGINNITKKFFKSFIGVCLQGVVMIVCLRVFNDLIVSVLDNLISNLPEPDTITESKESIISVTDMLWTMLLGSIALVVAVSKSGSWAKSMMDG